MFKESFNGVPRMFLGCFMENWSFVLSGVQGSFNGDSRELQGYPKEVQRVVQGSFMAVSKKF